MNSVISIAVAVVMLAGCNPSITGQQRTVEQRANDELLSSLEKSRAEMVPIDELFSRFQRELEIARRTNDFETLRDLRAELEEGRRRALGRHWDRLLALFEKYPGTRTAERVAQLLEQEERAAADKLLKAKSQFDVDEDAARKLLKRIVNEHPRTNVVEEAQRLLDQ
jgi:hypothetical protein